MHESKQEFTKVVSLVEKGKKNLPSVPNSMKVLTRLHIEG